MLVVTAWLLLFLDVVDSAILPRQNETCPAGETWCEYLSWDHMWDAGCVNLETHYLNCGSCANSCETPSQSDTICVNGECICYNSGRPDCGLPNVICPDPMTDRNHCGGCNLKCGEQEICKDGECIACTPTLASGPVYMSGIPVCPQ
ncbi:hypothetical protein CcaverHIS002_0609200 [Cutaneotrichosporon cavernicola]|nr:hypothetical protein CcaverHIS002_0609200 [Cutaneotrichosporon cavernicola]BEJ09945.1 hypothetical protein CcaverHIS641_0608600 [Cutaneotrichosporon cavernicola]